MNANSIAGLIPLNFYKLLIRRRVIGVGYHVVSDRQLNHVKHLFPYKSTEEFELDLVYLKENFNLISYEQLAKHLAGEVAIPSNSVIITVDDGYAECFSVMRPILLKHQVPCVFFVVTDFIDNRRMFYRNKISLCIEKALSFNVSARDEVFSRVSSMFDQRVLDCRSFAEWLDTLRHYDEPTIIDKVCSILGVEVEQILTDTPLYLTIDQIKTLVSDGFTIGSHTRSHPRLHLLGRGEIEEEIVESCKVMQGITGHKMMPFAFPHSGSRLSRSFLEEIVMKHNFIGLMFDTGGLKSDTERIVHRVGLDRPSKSTNGGSNVPERLHEAYRRQFLKTIARLKRPLSFVRA